MLVLSAGNIASKGAKRHMATSKKNNTGSRSSKGKKKQFKSPRRGNPGVLGSPLDWLTGGAGVLAGVVGTRAVPQLFLADKNIGGLGYFANAVTAAGLGWISHMVFPRNRVLTASVLAGGFAAVIARVIGDFTTYGKYLSLNGGVGDYMVSNAVAPQRLVDPGSAMVEVPQGWGAPMPSMVINSSGADNLTGVDVGRRSGAC
jgi:hypothetical protein